MNSSARLRREQAGGPFKPGFGLSGEVFRLSRVLQGNALLSSLLGYACRFSIT